MDLDLYTTLMLYTFLILFFNFVNKVFTVPKVEKDKWIVVVSLDQ